MERRGGGDALAGLKVSAVIGVTCAVLIAHKRAFLTSLSVNSITEEEDSHQEKR